MASSTPTPAVLLPTALALSSVAAGVANSVGAASSAADVFVFVGVTTAVAAAAAAEELATAAVTAAATFSTSETFAAGGVSFFVRITCVSSSGNS
jgi:hypothetical protein